MLVCKTCLILDVISYSVSGLTVSLAGSFLTLRQERTCQPLHHRHCVHKYTSTQCAEIQSPTVMPADTITSLLKLKVPIQCLFFTLYLQTYLSE